jgi:hypothetical protein
MADDNIQPTHLDPKQPDATPTPRSADVVRIPNTFEMRVRHAILWQARQAARAEVVRKLKSEGVKVALMSASKITQLTIAYLREHQAELLVQAEATGAVQRLRAEADLSNIRTNDQPKAR